ncbi:MAG: DUF1491 family protein [Pseudomonadota bacterium]
MRLTSSLWVSALIRRATGEGAFATIVNKGAESAGAIFVIVDDYSGEIALYGPAPQMVFEPDEAGERRFTLAGRYSDREELVKKIDRERSFDPDLWIVEIEDRSGPHFLDVVDPDA